MVGGHISVAVQSASVYGLKLQNGEPFRFQKEHQMQRQPLPVLRVHLDDEAAEDQDNLYEAFLKYHRQISEYAPLRDHRSLGGCHILTAGKYLHALWMDRLQLLRRIRSRSYRHRRYLRDQRNMRPVPELHE